MPRRRSFGYVFRRRRKRKDPSGKVRVEYAPGFYLRLRVGGKEVVRYAGANRDIAVAYAQRLTGEADRRDLLGQQPRSDMKFQDFAEQYLLFAKQSMTESSYDSRRRLVRGVVIPFFKNRLLDEIEPSEVQRILASRAGVAGATRNRALTALSAIYRRAIDLALVTKNPAREVRRSKESRLPLTLVPDGQVAALLGHLGEPQRTFFCLLVESGLRLSEAMRLEWPDVDFDEATIHVRVSKAKRPRIVAMTSTLRAVLFEHYQRRTVAITGGARVFPGAMGPDRGLRCTYRGAFKRAAKAIGVSNLRVHDLRHLYAITLVPRGRPAHGAGRPRALEPDLDAPLCRVRRRQCRLPRGAGDRRQPRPPVPRPGRAIGAIMVSPTPSSPATAAPPETGIAAAMAVVDVLFGRWLDVEDNRWMVGFRVPGMRTDGSEGWVPRQIHVVQRTRARSVLDEAAAVLPRSGGGVAVHPVLVHDEPGDPRGPLLAPLAIQVEVALADLFRERGPLFELQIQLPNREVDLRRLNAGPLAKARRFLRKHLKRAPFRPTIVLDGGWQWRLVFVLRRQAASHEEFPPSIAKAARYLARWIHGGESLSTAAHIPLPLPAGPERETRWRLLWVDPERRVDVDRILAVHQGLEAPSDGRLPAAAKAIPLALRLRTLPDDWDVQDLDLPDDLRQLVVAGNEVRGMVVVESVLTLVRAMAWRGYGWGDVEALLSDPRFPLAGSMRADRENRASLKRVFHKALAKAPPAYAPRLPYGIRRILEVPSPSLGDQRRYVVRCGPRRAPIEVEVTYDALVSASRFRRALGGRLGILPYPVTSEAWSAALHIALRDPRILGRLKPGAGASKPLSELIAEYAGTATPWNPMSTDDGNPLSWPLVRDGFVVFPLKHLQAFVDARTRGTRVGRATGPSLELGVAADGGDGLPTLRRCAPLQRRK